MMYLSLVMRYWKLAGMAVLLIALGVQSFRLDRAQGKLDKARTENTRLSLIIDNLADESDRRKAEGKRAIEADRPKADQRAKARTIIIREPGECKTAPDIAEALDKGWIR